MTFTFTKTRKLCYKCFREEFGNFNGRQTLTWGHECSQCHTPTPSRATLVKVETE